MTFEESVELAHLFAEEWNRWVERSMRAAYADERANYEWVDHGGEA